MPVLRFAIAIGVTTAAAISPPARAATSVVDVQLVDHRDNGLSPGLGIIVDHQKVRAGRVVFRVDNMSKSLVHEMLVVKVGTAEVQLPYSLRDDTLVEDQVKHLGEVPELKPGNRGTVTLTLAAGSYLLICNQPGHFHAGMWTPLTVTP